jgi:hypothetical protein
MKKGTGVLILLAFLLLPFCANAVVIKNFYTNGVIVDGNNFDQVNIWNNSTVEMIGGIITNTINTYNTSTLNVADGIFQGGALTFIRMWDSSILNLSGGLYNHTWIYPGAGTVNIYGRDLNWTIDSEKRLHGYWADNTEFLITFARIENANIILHEIPEPFTISLLLIGILGVRKIRG